MQFDKYDVVYSESDPNYLYRVEEAYTDHLRVNFNFRSMELGLHSRIKKLKTGDKVSVHNLPKIANNEAIAQPFITYAVYVRQLHKPLDEVFPIKSIIAKPEKEYHHSPVRIFLEGAETYFYVPEFLKFVSSGTEEETDVDTYLKKMRDKNLMTVFS